MEQPNPPSIRRRVNVTRLAKGNYTFECTVESVQAMPANDGEAAVQQAALLADSRTLRLALEAEYPMEKGA